MHCANCGTSNEEVARFCMECGQRLLHTQATPDTEWRQMTFLFCDLKDSTGLGRRLGPAMYSNVLARSSSASTGI